MQNINKATPPAWFTTATSQARESYFIEVADCKIHYQRYLGVKGLSEKSPAENGLPDKEANKPGLLFVHGGGAHCHWWDFIAPAFTSEYEVIAIDLSGMGDSGHREEYSNQVHSQELLAVCEHAGFKDNITVISHSFGGSSTLRLALKHPELLKQIIITDCTLLSRSERHEREGNEDPVPDSPFGEKRVYPSKEDGLKRFKLVPKQSCKNDFIVDYVGQHSIGEVENGWSWKFDMGLILKNKRDQLFDEIADIQCLTAMMYAEHSILFPADILPLYREKYPTHAAFYCLKDAQHHLLLDEPLAFIELLKEILNA